MKGQPDCDRRQFQSAAVSISAEGQFSLSELVDEFENKSTEDPGLWLLNNGCTIGYYFFGPRCAAFSMFCVWEI
jgi:hypothetical protein